MFRQCHCYTKKLLLNQENPIQKIEENAHQDMENHQHQGPSNTRNSIAKRRIETEPKT